MKINVIFNNKFNTQSQIVEIQFLLNFLLKAKKLGHKFYGIKRKDVEIHSVNNIMQNTNNNYKRYKLKILELIKDDNINQLTMHLFLRPNCILSMFDERFEAYRPYLFTVGGTHSSKMFELFWNCLFHFGEILLNEEKPLNYNIGCYNDYDVKTVTKDKIDNIISNHKLYIKKYLNFSVGGCQYIDEYTFVK